MPVPGNLMSNGEDGIPIGQGDEPFSSHGPEIFPHPARLAPSTRLRRNILHSSTRIVVIGNTWGVSLVIR